MNMIDNTVMSLFVQKPNLRLYCGMYIPLSEDEHRFVKKVHPTRANGHWERGHNSNPVASLPHAAVVLYATI